MGGFVDKIEKTVGEHPIVAGLAAIFGASALNGKAEELMSDHPVITGIAAGFAGHELDGHGVLRSIFDAYTGYELAKGNAGMISKLNLANNAREFEVEASQKAGDGWLSSEFKGLVAMVGSYIEEGKLEDGINKAKTNPQPKPAPTTNTSSNSGSSGMSFLKMALAAI